jgi:hypothetical protein
VEEVPAILETGRRAVDEAKEEILSAIANSRPEDG